MRNPIEYMRALLWRRGFRGRQRLAEAVERAKQLFEERMWLVNGPLPADWPTLRPVLDAIVYAVECELMPRKPIKRRGWRPSGYYSILDLLAEEELRRLAVAAVEQLAAPQRLVCKLKHADVFYGRWEDGELAFRPDEAEHVLEVHPGRSLTDVMTEFRARLLTIAVRQNGKAPSKVIAWLLGRASPDAVDKAYEEIKQRLRNTAPPGAGFVSKFWARGCRPGVAVAVPPLNCLVRSAA